jgi:hypothetical protein
MPRHDRDVQRLARAKRHAVSRFLPAAAPPKPKFVGLAAAISRRHNIVGVGVGPKIRDGRSTRTPSIRFYVAKKVPLKAIRKADRVPKRINGVPTDVVETGRFFAQAPIAQGRLRPAKGGCSVGFEATGFVMAGTLGCLVTNGTRRFILSNNHVLANENGLPLNSPIFQPGLLDGGVVPGDRIARLTRFVRLRKSPAENRVDAAIAALDAPDMAVPSILPRIGALGSSAPVRATVGMRVHKHGRTSGYTRGRVIDVSADVNVTYDFGVARFVDQMIAVGDAGAFSESGDSGSLIVRRPGNRATGLLFAGSGSHTIANHIGDVLAALGVTLVV